MGRANDRDEAIMTVQVSSADHELLEGYFTLGDNATVMVKPGPTSTSSSRASAAARSSWSLTEAGGPELSRLDR